MRRVGTNPGRFRQVLLGNEGRVAGEVGVNRDAGVAGQGMQPLVLMVTGVAVALTSWAFSAGLLLAVFLVLGASLVGSGAVLLAMQHTGRARHSHTIGVAARMIDHDPAASFVTDAQGLLLHRNRVAVDRLPRRDARNLTDLLSDMMASPAAIVGRLFARVPTLSDLEAASEDIVTRRGHLRLSVQQMDDGLLLWRLEDLTDRAGLARTPETMSLPMLTAGPSGTILFMNEAFRRLTGGRAYNLEVIFRDLPLRSGQFHLVETVEGPMTWQVAEVPGAAGRRDVYLIDPGPDLPAPDASVFGDQAEELPVPLLRVALTGELMSANREARALLPMPIGPGTRLSDLLEGLGRPIIDWLRDTADGRNTGGPQFLRGTGPHQNKYLRVSLGVTGHGENRHIIAILNDVTEHKSLEAQFVQSQKMHAIGQLAGGVAHDFNNLLTAISGHCDLLLLKHDEGDPEYADLIQIHQNANRAASLVGQLLAFSRKQSLMLEVLDLRDSLSDLTHLLNRLVGEKVLLTLHHDSDLRPIRADKRQLEQVLMNLVVNARDAMPQGGEIRIETETVHLTRPLRRDRATVPAGHYVMLRVVDQGVGIPAEVLPQIFEPFFTTKRQGEGTGLGLSTAYGIVKQTGGFIFADSTVGAGTVFTLYLPAAEQSASPPARPDAAMSWSLPVQDVARAADPLVLTADQRRWDRDGDDARAPGTLPGDGPDLADGADPLADPATSVPAATLEEVEENSTVPTFASVRRGLLPSTETSEPQVAASTQLPSEDDAARAAELILRMSLAVSDDGLPGTDGEPGSGAPYLSPGAATLQPIGALSPLHGAAPDQGGPAGSTDPRASDRTPPAIQQDGSGAAHLRNGEPVLPPDLDTHAHTVASQPTAREPVRTTSTAAETPADTLREPVVLLVEDEAPVRAFASRALRLRGFAVLEADSAEAALSMLRDPALDVDIFVTDVIMPGKDGPTWVREALANRPTTKVIFVSGYAEEAFSEQKALIPNSVFLPKPFSLTELTSTVQRQLH
jgi:two-component system, cell cycle sensor histidine kinase and response regulator CckA